MCAQTILVDGNLHCCLFLLTQPGWLVPLICSSSVPFANVQLLINPDIQFWGVVKPEQLHAF